MWLLLALACGSAPDAPPPPAGSSPATPPAPASVPEAGPQPPPQGFACCADPAARGVVDAYLVVQRSLVQSDAGAAARAATTLSSVAAAAGVAELVPLADAMKGDDLKALRVAFKPLSTAMIAYTRAHAGGSAVVAEAWCPMAPGGGGGWIQTEGEIRNPYFGTEMLTCGSFRAATP